MLALGTLLPAAFSDSGGVSPSVSTAPPNSTINLIAQATITAPTAPGYYDQIFFIAVLTPDGTMYGCISGSSACNLIGFTSTGAGTYQCTVPFGGSAASLSSVATGDVVTYGDCSGSNAGTWTGMSSTLCGGTAPTGANCAGTTGFNELVAGCGGSSVYYIGFGIPEPSPSSGDTSQVGTYKVVVCWEFVTVNPASAGDVFSSLASTTSFQITPTSGVPQFPIAPLSSLVLVAILLPALLIISRKFRAAVIPPI